MSLIRWRITCRRSARSTLSSALVVRAARPAAAFDRAEMVARFPSSAGLGAVRRYPCCYVPYVTTSAADWLTAIGTFGAVVVALATPAVTAMIRRARRPVLNIELSYGEPDLRPVLKESSDAIGFYWLRFTVTNSGRTTAEAVRAQLRRYWVRPAPGAGYDQEWVECVIDPQPLAWTSRPSSVDPARRAAVPIPGGSSDLATFAGFTVADALMTLTFLDADYVPPSPPTSLLVEYRFEVSVTADNADPVIAHLWCTREGEDGFLTGVGQGRKPPSAAQTHRFSPRLGNPPPSVRPTSRRE